MSNFDHLVDLQLLLPNSNDCKQESKAWYINKLFRFASGDIEERHRCRSSNRRTTKQNDLD